MSVSRNALSQTRSIEIVHEGRALRGTRYGPDEPRTHILFAHGFSANRMGSGRMIVDFARRLAARGFALSAFDRAGHGESDGAFFDVAVPDEIAQLSAMVDSVPGPLHLVGHSLGGMELATLAGRRPETVASLTLWAPAAASADEVARGEILGRPMGRIDDDHPFDVEGQALGPAFAAGFQNYDPFQGLDAYAGPVHLHHGESDAVVPPRYSHRYAEIWPQAELTLYPGADHGWSQLDTRRALMAHSVRQIEAATR